MSTAHEPAAIDASLHLLADDLLDAFVAGDLEPALLRIGGITADGFDLGLLPLENRHPATLLLGTNASRDWHALGVATTGRAYRIDEARRQAKERRSSFRVKVVTLLSRSGELIHRTWSDDDKVRLQLQGELPTGEQIDLLHRALGLATDPPPTPASTFWSIDWLGAILQAKPGTFEEAVALHPAMRLLERSTGAREDDAIDVVRAFHNVCSWERMREIAGTGKFDAPHLTASEARWLDEGAFSRWLLSRCPPLDQLRTTVQAECASDIATPVLDLLTSLGIPETAWPDDPRAASAA